METTTEFTTTDDAFEIPDEAIDWERIEWETMMALMG